MYRTNSRDLYIASPWKRLLAKLIDISIISLLWVGSLYLADPNGFFEKFSQSGNNKILVLSWYQIFFGFFVAGLYEVGFLRTCGVTPGKYLLELRICLFTSPVTPLNWKSILSKAFIGYCAAPLLKSLTFIPSFFRTDRRTVADLVSGTVVLQEIPRASPRKRPILGGLFLIYSIYLWSQSSASFYIHPEGIRLSVAVSDSSSTIKENLQK